MNTHDTKKYIKYIQIIHDIKKYIKHIQISIHRILGSSHVVMDTFNIIEIIFETGS